VQSRASAADIPGHMDRRTVSITQAAELVGVSRRTIYNWMAAGRLEYCRTAGGAVRIVVDSLWRPGLLSAAAMSPAVDVRD
jgi:excisionase family DNA binding protein